MERGSQFSPFSHWTASSPTTLFPVQSLQSGSFNFFVNQWYVQYLFVQFFKSNAALRSPFPILTRVLEVSSSWTTATSTILRRYAHLLKTMLVGTYQYSGDIILNNFLDCKLLFLPPYSPDLNPIEQAFSSIKNHLKRYCNDYSFSVIDCACQNISSDNAWGFFRALGYVVQLHSYLTYTHLAKMLCLANWQSKNRNAGS